VTKGWQESYTGVIELEDIDPLVFRSLSEFLHTGEYNQPVRFDPDPDHASTLSHIGDEGCGDSDTDLGAETGATSASFQDRPSTFYDTTESSPAPSLQQIIHLNFHILWTDISYMLLLLSSHYNASGIMNP
jgi:hypothetical protein